MKKLKSFTETLLKNPTMKKIQEIFKKSTLSILLTLSLIVGINSSSKACSPLLVPTLASQSIVGGNLLLNWNATTLYHCPDVILVEIACNGSGFSGLAAYSYTSAVTTGTAATYAYPTMTINIAALCPGTVYKFRAREQNQPLGSFSPWSANFLFTTPGVFVPPTVTILANPSVITLCPQGSSQLSMNCVNCCGGGPYTYTWLPASSLSCSTCASPIATPTVTTIYTLSATGGQLGCWAATNTVQVTVVTTPASVGIANSTPIVCAGNTGTVSVTSYSGAIQWQSAPNAGGPWTNVLGATSASFVTGPLAANTCYRANVIGCGPSVTSNTTCITVIPTLTVTTTGATICAGSTANLTASGGNSYVWSAGANPTGVGTANASPMTTTTYTVTGNISGCTGTAVATVSVNPMPVPIATNNGPICTGGSINLTGSGGGTYSWAGPNGFNSTLQNPIIASTSTLNQGLYILTVTLNGCTSMATTSVNVSIPFTITATNNGPICQGDQLNLSTTAGYLYNWSGPGFSSNLNSPNISNSQLSNVGVYTITATDANGCTSMATTLVNINPTPIVSIQSSKANLCAPACVSFTVNSSTSINNINWFFGTGGSSGSSTTTQCFNKGGFYTSSVSITDNNGCQGSTTHTIEIYQTPTADFVFAPLRPVENNEVTFTDASFGANITQWYWFFNSQVINSTFQNPNHTYTEIGAYPVTLIVKSDKGCMDTITQSIIIGEDYGIYIPSSFTPNGDGLNDTFSAKGYGITKFEMNIFDKWGEKLYTTNDIHNAWDGKLKEILCKEDIYVWKINLTNVFGKSHELTGHVTLIK